MNPEVLSHYDMTPDKKFIINIRIPDFQSLFDYYDDPSSFYQRDLNDKFVEHLIECVEEIGVTNDLVIDFHIPEDKKSPGDEKNVLYSVKNYFEYLILLGEKELKAIFTRLGFHIGIAVICFIIFMMINGNTLTDGSSLNYFFTTGLAVSVWVLVLTGFSRFLFRLKSELAEIKIFRKLKKTKITFSYKSNVNNQ